MTSAIRRMSSWGGVALLMLSHVPAVASTFLAMELPELVAESDSVVRGQVLSLDSRWDAQHRVILTEATVRIDEGLFGTAQVGRVVKVLTFGGQVGDYHVEAHGFPEFEKGDRVVLFLQRQQDRSLRVTGYQLGHYKIVEMEGVQMAVPTVERDTTLVLPDGQEVDGPVATPLTELRRDVRQIASELESPR